MIALAGLRVEHRVRPVGVDVTPRFSWILTGGGRGAEQISYRLRVAAGGEEVWDSGTVRRRRTYGIEYAGPPLPAATACDWTVEVETTHGPARAGSRFHTGLFTEADWAGAAWIGRAGPARGAPLLRAEFDPGGPVRAALLFVAAGGYAEVTVNGAPAGPGPLSPGFTDYEERVQYTGVEAGHLLREGPNTITVELGRGFYGTAAANTWDWHTAPWHGEPRVRLLLVADLADGTRRTFASSPSWLLADGPTTYDDPYGGESHDARLAAPREWRPADVLPAPAGRLVGQRQQPIAVTGELRPEEITEPAPGVYVARFPRVIAGRLALRARGPAGTRITVRYGERLTAAGRPNYDDDKGYYDGRFQTDELTLAGTGEERWASRFSWKGFQYAEITGWPGTPGPGDLVAQVLHNDVPVTGHFSCSDPALTRLHELTVATVLNNLHGLPTDTPKYEKNGWTGDGMLGAELFLRNLDCHELLAKWVDDIADTRRGNGAPEVIAPHGGWRMDWSPAPPWHAAYVLIPWWLYRYRGDERVLREHYPGMLDYVRFELARSPGGIADTTLGDWVSPETDPGGGNAPEDRRVAATAYLYLMLATLARAAGALGREEDARALRADADRVRAAFRARFLHEDGVVRGEGDAGFRQTHNVLAVAFGLVEGEEAARAAGAVAADARARGGHLNTGALGTKYLLPVLTDHGHAALAYEIAVNPEFPGWGFWLANGATTLWEHWSAESRSRGHYFLGTIDDWLFTHVAGLRQDGPGELTVRPALTGVLTSARAEVVTPYGPARVDWHRDGGPLTVSVSVPVGARALVRLPAGRLGHECREAAGVEEAAAPPGEIALRVRSGEYTFTLR
ncbi:alpha-L-rhamnosidase [Thermocatellispora tengchongensis]|uniref:alpha-L-rhamnosidase n=1 Tax=Thermocatellispora tengchongensis TaxID=1073253 RepID=A0A840P622_9ACTN|nr:alpha-L-rhamnosidase [Thermocatellispora tengchongensis]MBB5131455.1 alpha-L-rhamnosidase [Thermocatellispora tengchongensis]